MCGKLTRIRILEKLPPIDVLVLQILILTILVIIFLQDMADRSVYWFLFVILTILLAGLHLMLIRGMVELWRSFSFNLGFLLLQMALLTAYFSLKQKKLVNITSELLGLGDVLFLLSIIFYLSVLNFLFFYIASLVCVLLVWIFGQIITKKKNTQIPLAGLQAILFSLFLAGDWFGLHLNLTDDTWLLNLVQK